jgi:hypothetical protein
MTEGTHPGGLAVLFVVANRVIDDWSDQVNPTMFTHSLSVVTSN